MQQPLLPLQPNLVESGRVPNEDHLERHPLCSRRRSILHFRCTHRSRHATTPDAKRASRPTGDRSLQRIWKWDCGAAMVARPNRGDGELFSSHAHDGRQPSASPGHCKMDWTSSTDRSWMSDTPAAEQLPAALRDAEKLRQHGDAAGAFCAFTAAGENSKHGPCELMHEIEEGTTFEFVAKAHRDL